MVEERTVVARWGSTALTAVLVTSFLACYWQTIAGLVHVWSTNDDYSYAFLIPFISAYLIWEKRKAIAATPVRTNWLGGALFLFFLVISVYGILGSSPSAVRPAVPLVILSITLFCFGKEMLKTLALPLSLLIFMIPLPTLFGTLVGNRLRLASTQLGEIILRLAGVSVFVEGNVIDLGVTQLQVVDACSGLRYILPLFALGVLFAYFLEKTRWKQVVLVISTIPIAVITNGIRIGITGVLAERYGPNVADGFFHGFSGWLVFMFAFALLFLFHLILKTLFRRGPGTSLPVTQKTDRRGESNPGNPNRHVSLLPIILCAACLFIVSILSSATAAFPPLKIKGSLASFPMVIDGWKGRVQRMDPEIVTESGAQDALSAVYRDGSGKTISLYVGYRESPFNESENFFHSPYVCLPSSGWKKQAISNHRISDVPRFGTITVRKMVSERMGHRHLVYYWFQTKNRTSFDVNINRFHLAVHALRRDNTHDLFIRPITPVEPGETAQQAEARLDRFVRTMMKTLLEFLDQGQTEVPA
jgi:exosortase D (VPLPA-CTERM-specific)